MLHIVFGDSRLTAGPASNAPAIANTSWGRKIWPYCESLSPWVFNRKTLLAGTLTNAIPISTAPAYRAPIIGSVTHGVSFSAWLLAVYDQMDERPCSGVVVPIQFVYGLSILGTHYIVSPLEVCTKSCKR